MDISDPGIIDQLPEPQVPLPELPANIHLPQALEQWSEEGYVRINGFFSQSFIDTVNRGIDLALEKDRVHFNYTGRKIFNAQQAVPELREITHHPGILAVLHHLFRRPAVHFQTINFIRGSEQQAHSDSIHMTTVPLGYLAGVWVALEDIHESNGPLTYYPGSHQLPYILNSDYGNSSGRFLLDGNANSKYERKVREMIKEKGLEARELKASAGDVFIWHANLLHGGAAIMDQAATRKSMVSHYFAEGVLCFHEISERPAVIGK